MITRVSFSSNGQQKNNYTNKKKNHNVPIVVASTITGSLGGVGIFKTKGLEKEVNHEIENFKLEVDNLVKEQITKKEEEVFYAALESEKYGEILNELVFKKDKTFNKDFKLQDVLDQEDLKNVKNEIENSKNILQEALNNDIKELKQLLIQEKRKYVAIGATIGLSVSLLYLLINKIIKGKSVKNENIANNKLG